MTVFKSTIIKIISYIGKFHKTSLKGPKNGALSLG